MSFSTEEVLESIESPNPSKYRAIDEAHDPDDENPAAVPDDEFEWLEPQDFVKLYQESENLAHVRNTIAETNKNLASEQKDEKNAQIELVDYARDAKYPTSIWKCVLFVLSASNG